MRFESAERATHGSERLDNLKMARAEARRKAAAAAKGCA